MLAVAQCLMLPGTRSTSVLCYFVSNPIAWTAGEELKYSCMSHPDLFFDSIQSSHPTLYTLLC